MPAMQRLLALSLLGLLSLSGCYRVVRARGLYGTTSIARPTPLASGTYWTMEGGAAVSTGMSATPVVASYAEPSAYYEAEVSGSVDVSVTATATTTTTTTTSSSGSWSSDGGWASGSAGSSGSVGATGSATTGSATGSATGSVSAPAFGVDVDSALPSLGVAITGAGSRLSAIGTVGVTVDCDGCSIDGEIAALSRLVALGDGGLTADARVGGDANLSIEAALAHEGLPAAGGATEVVVRVRGGEAPPVPAPLRIHLVIDASTSMETRWDAVKDAAIALIGTLRAEDELSIVVYGDDARVALAPARVGSGAAARAVVRGLEVGGRTNIEAGLRAAYADVAPEGGSIVLLLSDGVPQGGAAGPDELGALAAEAYAREATTTVAIGLGVEFHAGILRSVATAGHGDFRIAPRMTELPSLLRAEIEAHGRVVARDVRVELDLGEGVRLGEGAPEGVTVVDGRASILLPAVAAGAELTFALPVVVDRAAVGGNVAVVSAGWSSASSAHGHAEKTLSVARTRAAVPAGSMRASLDLALRAVLELAAGALENGEAERAAALLITHAVEVEAVLAVHADTALLERARASRALAWSLSTLVPEASWPERRSTAAQMLAWSVRLGR